MSLFIKLSIATLLALFIFFTNNFFEYERYDWIATNQPIDVAQKSSYEFSFKSQKDTDYELAIEIDGLKNSRNIARGCLIGFTTEECGENSETLSIHWSIYQGDTMLASGISNAIKTENRLVKTLEKFKTHKGLEYRVVAKISNPDERLSIANPRLVIYINRLDYKSAVVSRGIYPIALSILAGLSILVFLIWFLTRKRKP